MRRYMELDVFSARPLYGNPLAVVIDAEGLDAMTMQRLAAWLNFSETSFLLPPSRADADYCVRIFTPRQELPFAGHPSVGAAWAAVASGLVDTGKSTLVQECAAGLLPVEIQGHDEKRIVRVQAPAARIESVDADLSKRLSTALGAQLVRAPVSVCNGPTWLTCDLGTAAPVRALHPDMPAVAALTDDLQAVGVCVFGRESEGGIDMAVRAFCPADGIPEDPVTGSANAAIAAWLHVSGSLADYGQRYRASQGREVGRDGLVEVSVGDDGNVSIGGACSLLVEGSLRDV